MLTPSNSSASLSDTAEQEISQKPSRGQQVTAPLLQSGDNLYTDKTCSTRDRKPLALTWNTVNLDVLGSLIDLLNSNNKKRSRDAEEDHPVKRRLSLDTATITCLKEGIVEALSEKVQQLINTKLSFIQGLQTEVEEIKKTNAESIAKLTDNITANDKQYSRKFDEISERLAKLESAPRQNMQFPPTFAQKSLGLDTQTD